jgi:hypothetical protein
MARFVASKLGWFDMNDFWGAGLVGPARALVMRFIGILAASLLCYATALPPHAMAAGATDTLLPDVAAAIPRPSPPGPFAGLEPAMLSLYKTITYTATVLTTDQLWYMGMAAQAATTSGIFGVVNVVTSPMLTYAFEYTWEKCCEAPPGPDGVRPVDVKKAVIYRVLSTARIFGLALLFGNGLGSSVITTGAIAATRTLVYMTNDFVWNRLTSTGTPPSPSAAIARQ